MLVFLLWGRRRTHEEWHIPPLRLNEKETYQEWAISYLSSVASATSGIRQLLCHPIPAFDSAIAYNIILETARNFNGAYDGMHCVIVCMYVYM